MKLSKWHALGNDYLLVEPGELAAPLTPGGVRRLCDYHYGVGSDGLLEVMGAEGATADLRIWNPDGSTAELSGNGVRIVAAWLARRSGAEHITVRVAGRRLGPRVERHSRFPERTNVQLVRVDGKHELTVGVWERGAGETLSSGTSAVAAAAAAVAQDWCESPVRVRLPGGELIVEIDGTGRALLTGPAERICTVELSEQPA